MGKQNSISVHQKSNSGGLQSTFQPSQQQQYSASTQRLSHQAMAGLKGQNDSNEVQFMNQESVSISKQNKLFKNMPAGAGIAGSNQYHSASTVLPNALINSALQSHP